MWGNRHQFGYDGWAWLKKSKSHPLFFLLTQYLPIPTVTADPKISYNDKQ